MSLSLSLPQIHIPTLARADRLKELSFLVKHQTLGVDNSPKTMMSKEVSRFIYFIVEHGTFDSII